MKRKMIELKNKLNIKVVALQLAICGMMFPMEVEAASDNAFTKSTLFKGIKDMATDFLTALIVITAVITAALLGLNLFKYQQSPEEEKPKHIKSIKSTLIAGVLILCTEGLVTLVFSYFI